MNLYNSFHFIKYFLFSRHRKGHGINSPYIYDFIKNVLNNNTKDYQLKIIPKKANKLFKELSTIKHYDLSQVAKEKKYEVKPYKHYKKISVPFKYGKILSYIIKHYSFKNIVELGTGYGISSAYMGLFNYQSLIYTVDASSELLNIAKLLWSRLSIKNIVPYNEIFDSALDKILSEIEYVDFAFIDGNHSYNALLNYYQKLKTKVNNASIFVLDDIYYSKSMKKAWKEICKDQDAKLTIDLCRFGIIFFTDKLIFKQHYTVRYY